MKMLLTCACTPGMDGTKPTITVADKQKETASLWKFMVDAVFVVVIIKFRRISKIYVKIEEVFSNIKTSVKNKEKECKLFFSTTPRTKVFFSKTVFTDSNKLENNERIGMA